MTVRRAVLVFVRAPQRGRVKTRLAASLGEDAALRIYRRLAEHAVAQARALAGGAWLRIHHTPADREGDVASWLGGDADYLPQADGGLGERLTLAFDQAFAAGFAQVLVIGSDLPHLTTAHLRQAFDALDTSDAVLGPARDGGYWLLGLRKPVPGVFAGIAWSTDAVYAQTVHRLRTAGVEPVLLEELGDVDEAADLPPGWAEWAVRDHLSTAEG